MAASASEAGQLIPIRGCVVWLCGAVAQLASSAARSVLHQLQLRTLQHISLPTRALSPEHACGCYYAAASAACL